MMRETTGGESSPEAKEILDLFVWARLVALAVPFLAALDLWLTLAFKVLLAAARAVVLLLCTVLLAVELLLMLWWLSFYAA